MYLFTVMMGLRVHLTDNHIIVKGYELFPQVESEFESSCNLREHTIFTVCCGGISNLLLAVRKSVEKSAKWRF
jgi:hypothetical protein